MTIKDMLNYLNDEELMALYMHICREAADRAVASEILHNPHIYFDSNGFRRYGCPICYMNRGVNETLYYGQKYCCVCGCKIEWEGEL